MKKVFFVLIAFLLFFTTNNLTHSEEKTILFHSTTSGYCAEVIQVIEENNHIETLNIQMIEASEDGARELFRSSLEECNLDPDRGGYPTLYHNGECSVGSVNAINTLNVLAGIETNTELENTNTEDVTDRTLDEVLIETEETEVVPRPFSQYVLMIIGPALLIGLGYIMIKKLNL